MVSIVVAAPPNSAIYHAVNGGYTTTDHLLATQLEYQAGLVGLPARIARAGVTDTRPTRLPNLRDSGRMMFDSMTIDEYEARKAGRRAKRSSR